MTHKGSCHCGAVAFEFEGDVTKAFDCNCSFCRRRGGLLWFVASTDFRLTTPAEAVSTYTFNKHVIRHHFCATCGIATHSESDSAGGRSGVMINLRCVEGVDFDVLRIRKYDGRAL